MTSRSSASEVLQKIDEVAEAWVPQRAERFGRRHLERSDFDELAATGFLRLVVPESHGGLWRSLPESGPTLVEAVQRIARGDQSVALVASMHPSVLIYWATVAEAAAPYTEAWASQREQVFQTALDGHFWGTISSEPGSGGDIYRTKATATPIAGSTSHYQLHGAKHFGSGSQMVSYMITIAKPDGSDVPQGFFMDLRDQPWDGTGGLTITREWDGMGMKATQSHAVQLEGVTGEVWAWPDAVPAGAATAGALGLAMYCGVIDAVVDAAMLEAESRLFGKDLRPYEDVAWTQAQVDHWMLTQGQRGIVDSLASDPIDQTIVTALKAKLAMAATAESVLSNISRAVGGGAFSASSPFATWYEDVRALGYLRPPWALAFDHLMLTHRPADTTS